MGGPASKKFCNGCFQNGLICLSTPSGCQDATKLTPWCTFSRICMGDYGQIGLLF